MKKFYTLICCLTLFISCKNEQPQEIEVSQLKETTKNDQKGTIEVSMDGKTYVYNNIDWKKSRIKNEEDILLSIRQNGLPRVMFKFPDIEKSLRDGQNTFKIPDVNRRGFSPITLNFILSTNDKKREAITFRKGQVKASFNDNHFVLKFEGQGGPTLDGKINYPIRGILDINF